jgi:AcrR family transcriptional regulator
MVKPKKQPRRYDASRRRQRAEETRERMLEAAQRLFAERGYAETTIESMATAADVAVPTVYAAFQSKRGVLSALMERLVSGEPGAPPLLETAGAREVSAQTDPRRLLELFGAHLSQVQERAIPTYEVMKSAARSEPDVAELVRRLQAYRFANITTLPLRLAELGALRPGLSIEDASRTIWAIASPEVRQMMQSFAGWSADRYRAWLVETLVAVLLPPATEHDASPRVTRTRRQS